MAGSDVPPTAATPSNYTGKTRSILYKSLQKTSRQVEQDVNIGGSLGLRKRLNPMQKKAVSHGRTSYLRIGTIRKIFLELWVRTESSPHDQNLNGGIDSNWWGLRACD